MENKPAESNTEIKQFHLINESAELQPGLEEYMKQYQFGKEYAILSIIGSQSTGKSTLLNKLFETNFEVLNSSIERRQVTKGIWLAGGVKQNLIILDVEGSDSKERWDERHFSKFFEQSTALFALALSQILIINLWTHEVGRFSGSQYGILKVIFEMNIKLFGQDQLKTILFLIVYQRLKQLVFILRDYSEIENFEEIKELIKGDIQRIWEEITKPEEFQKKKPEELFKIQFFKLSHMRYAQKEFAEGIEGLKKVFFDKSDQKYILQNFAFENNLLLNDVPLFAQKIWDTIKSNKDLNLPSEKIVVANMRCNQIQQESMELIAQELKTFHKTNSSKQIYHTFGDDGKQIMKTALKFYDENSVSYQKDVREEKRAELENQLISKFYVEFEQQRKMINTNLLTQYIQLVESLELDSGEMQDLMDKLNETREKQIQQFQSAIYKSIIKDNVWEIEEDVAEFKGILVQQQNTFVDKFLNFFLSKKNKQLKKEVEKIITANFDTLGLDFWSNIKTKCDEILRSNEENILKILQQSFELDPTTSKEKLRDFKSDYASNIECTVKRKCQDLHYYLKALKLFVLQFYKSLKRFKNLFERKENGAPINWRLIEEEEIEEKYKNAKSKVIELLNQFQYFKLNMQEIGGSETCTLFNCFLNVCLELPGDRLIEEDKLNKMIAKLNLDFDQEKKDAADKHDSKAQSGIPKWMWALITFFIYDDVLRWLNYSLFFYPMLLTLIFVGVSFSIGQKQLPLQILNQIIAFIKEKFGSTLYRLGARIGLN